MVTEPVPIYTTHGVVWTCPGIGWYVFPSDGMPRRLTDTEVYTMTRPSGTFRPIPDLEAEMDRLAAARQPPKEHLLADNYYPMEQRKLPDGTDEVVYVRIRVTAGLERSLPEDFFGKLRAFVRENWPASQDGWERTWVDIPAP